MMLTLHEPSRETLIPRNELPLIWNFDTYARTHTWLNIWHYTDVVSYGRTGRV